MTDEKVQIVAAFSAAWARRDLDAVMALFAEDCVYAASVGPEPGTTFRGREAVRAGIEQMFRHDEGSTVRSGRVFSDQDRVFAEWIYEFPAATGKRPAHGCDVFEFHGNKISLKDAFRKQLEPALAPETARGVEPGIYTPRRFESLEPWIFGETRLKPILISHRTDRVPYHGNAPVLEAAKAKIERLIPAMDAAGRHFGLGFVILHEGEEANWLLFDWWLEGGIACHVLCRSTHADPLRFERVDLPVMACVWEMAALAHERGAWIRTMMTGSPDPEAYLGQRMPAGLG